MAFFQCDLSGADGWTVAAHAAALGDDTMLLDYQAKLKPAKIIVLLQQHGSVVNTWDRAELIRRSKDVTEEGPEGWRYFAAKRVQHSSNYGVGKASMSAQILLDSYNKIGQLYFVSAHDCQLLQDLYLVSRYPGVVAWQNKIRNWLHNARGTPTMACASGNVRAFFGRRQDHDTYKSALAHEPQANTTYATNLAIWRLWSDPSNRDSSGSLIVQPLHQVHDAICGQFPLDRADWACTKLHEWFNNSLSIAGIDITIPFDGAYGPSWGELTHSI